MLSWGLWKKWYERDSKKLQLIESILLNDVSACGPNIKTDSGKWIISAELFKEIWDIIHSSEQEEGESVEGS